MPQLHETQQKIVDTIRLNNGPMTISQIAREMGVTTQTVRNHVTKLENWGEIELHRRRIGGANAYILSEGGNYSLPLIWDNNEQTNLRAKFLEIAETGGFTGTAYWRSLQRVIANLYMFAMIGADPENAKNINPMEIRQLRVYVAKIRDDVIRVRNVCDDMLSISEFWNQQELVKALIINDMELDIEKVRSIIDMLPDEN